MISAVAKTFYFMTPKLFTELGLSPELLKAIDKLGYEQAHSLSGGMKAWKEATLPTQTQS